MVSISSKTKIYDRTIRFWKEGNISALDNDSILKRILQFLRDEYDLIPERERIGKGSVYISKVVAGGICSIIEEKYDVIDFVLRCFHYKDKINDNHMKNFAISLLGEVISINKQLLIKGLALVKDWSTHRDWEIREMSGLPIRRALKKFPEIVLMTLTNWIRSENPNLRRFVAESTRPLADIKWLRDSNKNDAILDLLTELRSDSSEYVRKSVGNNLKDLSKYMPEKILGLMEEWISLSNIKVTQDISSKTKNELGDHKFFLIWTIKHALRWLKERNSEFYRRIEGILGINYILYFDEKRNILAQKRY